MPNVYLSAVDNESMQIAKQTNRETPATTGFKIMNTLSLEPKRDSKFDTHKRAGSRHTTSSRQNTSMSTLALSGGADYNEFGFPAAGAISIPTSGLEVDATIAYAHLWTPFTDAPNPVRYYTAEWGRDYIRRVECIRFDSFGLKSVRTGKAEINGSAFGGRIQDSRRDAITRTAGGVAIAKAPMTGLDIAYKLGDAQADLAAATLLTDSFALEWMLAAIAAAVMTHNRELDHDGDVEQKDQKGTMKLLVPVSDDNLDLMDMLATGEPRFIRFEAIGPIIEDDIPYSLTIDTAVTIDKEAEDKTEQNVLALEFPLIWAHDATINGATRIRLVNTIASY